MNKIKLLTITLALFQPILILYFFGADFKSFSKCFNTVLEPYFIGVNLLVAYCFTEQPRWRLSALFLLLLTCFSTCMYKDVHNLLAVAFFLSCLYPLTEFKSMKMYLYIYSFSVVIGAFFGLFWFECWAIYTLIFYHLNLFKINYEFEHRNKI